ncbi:MAG: alpha/beta hydrolase family esterase [Acidimicrobiales bacterium]
MRAAPAVGLLVPLALLAACGHSGGPAEPPPQPAVQMRQFTFDGVVRHYRVYDPPTPGARPPSALVVVLHGGAASIDDAVSTTMFDQAATEGNFIVAYPQGIDGVWNAKFCCGVAPGLGNDDVGFLNQLLDRLEAEYPVDTTRVYFSGVSNGAMMAYLFACEHADRVTAVGAVAGAMVLDTCQPSRPVSILEIHGTADPEVPYQGGQAAAVVGGTFDYPSSMALAQRWAQIDGCGAKSSTTAGPDTTASWSGCQAGTAVSLVSVDGGGHVWFAPGLGAADGSVDATSLLWHFFSRLRA